MTSPLPLPEPMDIDIAQGRRFAGDCRLAEFDDVRDGADDGQPLLYCH
jgi:hypothetical protein